MPAKLLPESFQPLGRFRYSFIYVLIACFYLWLVSVFRVDALLHASYDDGLFLRLANELLSGNWLGTYDHLTLAKGLGYPVFVALCYKLGWPLLLSQNLLYILSVALLCLALRPLVNRPLVRLAIFLILLFNPAIWSMQRPIRDHFYTSVTLLVLACAIGVFSRCRESISRLAWWMLGLGGSMAVLWNTREESIWLVPAVLFLLAFSCLRIFRGRLNDGWKRTALILLALAIPVLCGLCIATINYFVYGAFVTTETSNGSFVAAYSAVSRVKHQNWQRYVTMPAETRERVYTVSPAYAQLRPFLEDVGRYWKAGCSYDHPICGKEYFGGWYLWAFRDGVAYAGHHRSAPEAEIYYKKLADEVNRACDSGHLDCLPSRNTLSPPLRREYVAPFIDSVKRVTRYVIGFDLPLPSDAPQKRSNCLPNGLKVIPFRGDIYPCEEGEKFRIVTAWAFSPDSEISFEVRSAASNASVSQFSIQKSASPDVAAYAKQIGMYSAGADNARFVITVDSEPNPLLDIKGNGGLLATVDLVSGKTINQAERMYLYIESVVGTRFENVQSVPAAPFRLRLLSLILSFYQKTLGWLTLCALASLLMLLPRALRANGNRSLCIIIMAVLIAIITRIALIAFIDTSSFWSLYYYYLGPVYPLLGVFCLTSLYAFVSQQGAKIKHLYRRLISIGRRVEKEEWQS